MFILYIYNNFTGKLLKLMELVQEELEISLEILQCTRSWNHFSHLYIKKKALYYLLHVLLLMIPPCLHLRKAYLVDTAIGDLLKRD